MDNTTKLCVETTRELRSAYYKYSKTQYCYDSIPFGGSIRESIGPFPEFILKGRFCKRSIKGYCTPCFYSRLPDHDISEKQFNNGYLQQVDYIINHFEDLVLKNQIGKVAFPFETSKQVCGMVCTPTGSYFDNIEYPLYVRKENLKKLYKASVDNNCEIALHIESHAEDVVEYLQNPDSEEIDLLQRLHARIMLGFESVDALTRNIHYAKELDISIFEKAVKQLQGLGFSVGAFVFAGLFAMSEHETIEDTYLSFIYLKSLNVTPVLMFANTQPYTISDVLKSVGQYKLLDPRTVCTIVKNMLDIFGCDMSGSIDPWLIADPKGGPPDPNLHIFNSPQSTACPKCASEIYDSIERLRITKDILRFTEDCEKIDKCSCRHEYQKLLNQQKAMEMIDRIKRVERCVDEVKQNREAYVLKMNPWVVKAELLCYGLNMTDEQFDCAEKINPFIREKGFVHAVHIRYQDTLINTCVAEKFCKQSPYHARIIDSQWHLMKNEFDLGMFAFLPMPEWTSRKIGEITIGSMIRPHADKCVSLWPSTICSYVQQGVDCKFCCLSLTKNKTIMNVQDVVDALDVALSYNHQYEVNLSGGICGDRDSTICYLADICSGIRKRHEVPISIECAPPTSVDGLIKLQEVGVTSIIMNIEIFDEKLRGDICPGKSEISVKTYMDMLCEAVKIFGRGNVSSVLIVGIQPEKDVEVACKELVSIGVIPTLIPFKPLDDSYMENHPVINVDGYIRLSKHLEKEMRKNYLGINGHSGCAACGACSLETNLCEVRI